MIRESEVREVIALLPETSFLKYYVIFAEHQSASHLIYHVASALSILGATASRALVGDGPGFKAPTFANFYTMIVGSAGDAEKTLAVRIAAELLAEAAPLAVGSDPTAWESLVKALAVAPGQVLIYPEFGQWLAATSGHGNVIGSGLRKGLTNVFDGLTISKQYSKVSDPITVHDPRLSILGACTPVDLETYTTAIDISGGFLSRIFFAVGERERTSHSRTPIPDLRSWLLTFIARAASHGMQGETVGQCLGFEPNALAHWLTWTASITERFGKYRKDTKRSSIVARVPLLCAKICVSLAWSSGKAWGPHPWSVTFSELLPAIQFAEMHLRGALSIVENIASSVEMQEQRILLNVIGPTWKPLGLCLKEAGLTAKRARPYIDTLTMQGLIASTDQGGVPYLRAIEGGAPAAYNFDLEAANAAALAVPPPTPGVLYDPLKHEDH